MEINYITQIMARPRKHVIEFTDEEVKDLKSRLKSTKTNKTVRGRIEILLLLDTNHSDPGYSYETVGRKSGTSLSTVRTVVRLFAAGGLEAVLTLRRNPNSDTAKTKMDGRAEARILKIACGPAPEGRSRWTLRLLEERCRIELEEPVSKDTIRRALKKINFDLTKTPTGAFRPQDQENS